MCQDVSRIDSGALNNPPELEQVAHRLARHLLRIVCDLHADRNSILIHCRVHADFVCNVDDAGVGLGG